MTPDDFFKEIEVLYPEAIPYLNQWDPDKDLPYFRMTGFTEFTYDYYCNNYIEKYNEILNFVESKIINSDYNLSNMICTSFVEDLIFVLGKNNKAEMIITLPTSLRAMYEALKPLFEKNK